MIDSPVCRLFVLIGLWAIVMGGICEKAFASRIPFDKIKKSASDLQAEAIRQLHGKAQLDNIMTFSFEIA